MQYLIDSRLSDCYTHNIYHYLPFVKLRRVDLFTEVS